ncbi:MAG TPA: thioredoxin domain-containing protein [Myxococcaceae bacterium]|nr:thioredoxin domain-containing protein [Myxococcaceae bacterium]
MKTVFLGLSSALFLFAACNKSRSATTTAAGGSADLPPDTVVATMNGQKITAKELDDKISAQLAQLEEQKHNARKQGLENMINERLIQDEAKKRGMNEDALIKAEVEDKVTPPTEEEIKKFYDANQARMGGMTYEQMKDRLAQYLSNTPKQAKFRELITRLKEQAGVKITLPAPPKPRKQVAATGPTRGPSDAKVTIVEFSDFQCPFCGRAHDTVEEVMRTYAGKVKLVYRQMPLTSLHPNAMKAAEASLCAHEQGKFWEYHDTLFKNQQALQVDKLKEYATQMGLDGGKFNACLDGSQKADAVKADMKDAEGAGVQGTPAFFVNGVFLNGAVPIDEFREVIDTELAGS